VRRRPPRVPAPLAILLAVAGLQFAAWLVVLPALQSPDEHSHFAYTQRLVETGQRPPLEGDADAYSPELDAAWYGAGIGPLIGNLSARPYWTGLDERLWRARDRALGPDARNARTGPNAASRNGPVYYAYAGVAYAAAWEGSFFDRLYAMRLANLPLYLFTIVMTWVLAGQLLGPARWPRTIAAGVVAVHPQFAFVSAGVSPDVMVTAIWAAFLVLAVRTVTAGFSWVGAVGLAALAVASVLTHPRGAPLALLAMFAVGLAVFQRSRRILGRALVMGGLAGALALAVIVAILVSRADLLDPASGSSGFKPREFVSYLWQFYLPRLPFMNESIGPDYGVRTAFVETFFGVFASLEVRWPGWVYDVLAVLSVVGLAALCVVVVRARSRLRGRRSVVALLVAIPLVIVFALHFAAYRNLLVEPSNPVIVGRYLLPLVPLFGVAVAVVLRAVPKHASIAGGTVLLLTGSMLGLSGLGMTVVRFYV